MKRAALSVIVGLALLGGRAQVSIGDRAGVGFFKQVAQGDAHLVQLWEQDVEALLAPALALPVEVQMGKHFLLRTEFAFAQRGVRRENAYAIGETRINSAEFALLPTGFIDRGRWRPFAFAGIAVARPISTHFRTRASSPVFGDPDVDRTVDSDDLGYSKIGYMAVVGGGLSVRIGVPRIFIDYRYAWGLNPLDELSATDMNGVVSGKVVLFDRGHVISLGLMIPVSRKAWQPDGDGQLPPGQEQR